MRSIKSLQWLEDYRDTGDVKLVCGLTQNNMQLLKRGARLVNTDRPHLVAVVDSVTYDDDSKTGKLTVRAMFSASAWGHRVVMYTETVSNVEDGMLRIAANNRRGLACGIAEAQGFADTVDTQYTWGSVLDALRTLAASSTLGFYSRVDSDMTETLTVYCGVDRTDPYSVDYVGHFSRAARNIAQLTVEDSDSDYYNCAIVCGQGEESARRIVRVDLSNGAPLREIYIDARDIGAEYTITHADGTTEQKTRTAEEQDAALTARGIEKLAEHGLTFVAKASLRQTGLLFGRDYELGDILPLVLDMPTRRTVAVRVISAKLIYETAKTVEITLEVME